MKFSYGDNYYIRRESYVTGYKANYRLTIYTTIAVLYAVVEWLLRIKNPDSIGILYTGIAITGEIGRASCRERV